VRFTKKYSTIKAVFDNSSSYEKEDRPGNRVYIRKFKVGIFDYSVGLILTNKNSQTYDIGFQVDRVHASDKELEKYLKQRKSKMSPQQFRSFIKQNQFAILNTGNAFHVFSAVMHIVLDFMNEYPDVKCVTFNSEEESRTSLYSSIIKKFFSDYHVSQETYGTKTFFKICRPQG
jgi:hypothetical protein